MKKRDRRENRTFPTPVCRNRQSLTWRPPRTKFGICFLKLERGASDFSTVDARNHKHTDNQITKEAPPNLVRVPVVVPEKRPVAMHGGMVALSVNVVALGRATIA